MKHNIDQTLLLGLTAHKEGKIQEAEQFYLSILKTNPNHPETNHNLGIIKAATNNLAAALPLFKIAIEANPKVEQFWISYINLLINKKEFVEAEENFRKAITIIPNSPVIYNNLGGILYTLHRLEESEKSYKKAIKLKPDYAQPYNNLGVVLYELGKMEESEKSYKKAIKLKPDYIEAHSNLAAVLSEIGKLELAEASCKKAILLNQAFYKVYCTLGYVQKEMGKGMS